MCVLPERTEDVGPAAVCITHVDVESHESLRAELRAEARVPANWSALRVRAEHTNDTMQDLRYLHDSTARPAMPQRLTVSTRLSSR